MQGNKARVAMITGVTRQVGIGAAIAATLARAGINLFITYYRPFDQAAYSGDIQGDPERIIDSLKASGIQVHGVEADLSDPTVPTDLFDRAESLLGPVDILIN